MQKYRFLPFAAKVLRIVAWIVLIVGVIGSIVYGIQTATSASGTVGGLVGGFAGFFIAVLGIIFFFLAWVFLLTARELLYLFMDVEENTRNTAERITITEKSGRD
jgi:uncharacterized membrane protein